MIGYRKHRFAPTDNEMFGADPLAIAPDPFRFASPGTCFGPLAAAAPYIALATTVASSAMTIAGGAQQSQAQREAGQVAYTNALLRNQQAQAQAQQEEVAAGQQVAEGQRAQLEQIRRGQVLAGRARAVMAAGGGGVDENLVASLAGEGAYAGDVAAYDANQKSTALRNQAALTRWSGDAGVGMGAFEQTADNRAADATLFGAIGKGALSFAAKYGGSFATNGGGIDPEANASGFASGGGPRGPSGGALS